MTTPTNPRLDRAAAVKSLVNHTFTLTRGLLEICLYNDPSLGAPHTTTHRYCVVDRLSPVSTSVANTLKRSLLIFLTIIYFGNEMTAESAGGVVVVVCGVGLYNWARVRYPAPAADDEVPSAGDKDDT